MTLDFQKKSLFAHLSFGLPLLKFVLCNVVERTNSSDEQKHNLVGVFCSLNLCDIKQRKEQKLLLVFVKAENMEHDKKDFGLCIKRVYVQSRMLVVVRDVCVSALNTKENVLLRRNVEALVIKRHTYNPLENPFQL